MATTTTVHAQLVRYNTSGDQVIVNLKSTGSDISIDRSSNTKLPSSVSTAQTLANALGNLAFKDSLAKGDVGLGSVDNTADANKSVKYATSAGSAGSATKDSANQQISTTYIKSLSASGRTITITKGDGTTSTLTTQDTNTTYGVFAKATADAAGGTGLVPAPAKGQQGLYLRGDGSWQPQPIPLMACLKLLQVVLLAELVWFLSQLQVPKANSSEETELGRHLQIPGEVFRII